MSKRGFTLIEIILSLSLLSLLIGMSLPVYQQLQTKNDLDIAAAQTTQMLRRAQLLARGIEHDDAWGVHIGSSTLTLYKGTVYAARDATHDEETGISPSITSGGLTDIVFNKLTGFPLTAGTTTFTSQNGDTRSITINQKGAISN